MAEVFKSHRDTPKQPPITRGGRSVPYGAFPFGLEGVWHLSWEYAVRWAEGCIWNSGDGFLCVHSTRRTAGSNGILERRKAARM